MAELADFGAFGEADEKEIHVDMLDYEYVNSCEDIKILKGILKVLKSGKEGIYPHLIKSTEERLLSLLPEKDRQRYLRIKNQATPGDIMQAEEEMSSWLSNIQERDQQLRNKSHSSGKTIFEQQSQGEDEYNHQVSEEQLRNLAERERVKGNEHFKAGDSDKAVDSYSKSLNFDGSSKSAAIVYANRAMVYIKQQRYDRAEADCSASIDIDPEYIKSWTRRGMTRFYKGKYYDAICDYLQALELDKSNKELLALLEKAKAKYAEVEGKEFQLRKFSTSSNHSNMPVRSASSPPDVAAPSPVMPPPAPPAAATFKSSSISIHRVTSADELVMISPSSEILVTAKCMTRSLSDLPAIPPPPVPQSSAAPIAEESSQFTRIVIEDEDDEKEEAVRDVPEQQEFTRIAITEDDSDEEEKQQTQDSPKDSFTRITITEESDEDSSDETNESFTRIQISEESEEEEEQVQEEQQQVEEVQSEITEDPQPTVDEIDKQLRELKDIGNNFMKKEQYQSAIASYSKAVEIYHQQSPNLQTMLVDSIIAVYNNRSQAYLKINQYHSALTDSKYVIDQCRKSPPGNSNDILKKALFRSGLAYRGVSQDEHNLNSAIEEFKTVLSLDPTNQLAKKELQATQQMLAEKQKAKSVPIRNQPTATAESKSINTKTIPAIPAAVGGAAIDLKPVQTKYKQIPTTKEVTPSPVVPPVTVTKIDKPVTEDKPKPSAATKASSITSPTGKSKIATIPIPTEPPKSEYEFERIWRSLRSSPESFVQYLALFKSTTLKKLYKNASTISSDLLSSVLKTLLDYGDSKLIYRMLTGLSMVSNLEMMLALLPESDELSIKLLFDKLTENEEKLDNKKKIGLDNISSLRKAFFK